MLLAALLGLDIPIKAATTEGVNFVDGAEAARDRRVVHALIGIFGYPFDAIPYEPPARKLHL